MERTILLLVLCTAVEGDTGKHIFVPEEMIWSEAQNYCRKQYTDLSYVRSQSGVDRLRKAAGGSNPKAWIGLHRDLNNLTGWKWSGGGHMTFQNWIQGQPDNYCNIENSVHVNENGEWNDDRETKKNVFYCINITVVEVKKTWEKALEHCRENQSDLTSLLDETEHLLAWKEALEVKSERVWIGLRYLGDRWLWVNGDPLQYEAWPQGDQDHQCPIYKRCGALTKGGLWENWDCNEQLNFICI